MESTPIKKFIMLLHGALAGLRSRQLAIVLSILELRTLFHSMTEIGDEIHVPIEARFQRMRQ